MRSAPGNSRRRPHTADATVRAEWARGGRGRRGWETSTKARSSVVSCRRTAFSTGTQLCKLLGHAHARDGTLVGSRRQALSSTPPERLLGPSCLTLRPRFPTLITVELQSRLFPFELTCEPSRSTSHATTHSSARRIPVCRNSMLPRRGETQRGPRAQ